MARNSSIEWTHHTFNPWWGCTKISPACDHCYAELWAKRMGHRVWSARAPRRFFSDAHWRQPIAWNQEAKERGVRERVFCASMADVFESRPELQQHRERLWSLIETTPNLDWLLLTKRPDRVGACVPWSVKWPDNVWLGTSVENQEQALRRIPELIAQRAQVRFLSCEPLLGLLDLGEWLRRSSGTAIHWIIAGGESGPRARPMHPSWIGALIRQCDQYRVPFHFKQWGQWAPAESAARSGRAVTIESEPEPPAKMIRLPKAIAGRVFEGRVWNELPA